ncbi:MAG: glutamate ligase domain-containing protein, partial [Cryomorphaceae bacterium]
ETPLIYKSLSDFAGASKRLELVAETDHSVFYKDFAHAPSKLKATTAALKGQFPARRLTACMELHTFSSLNKEFLPLYKGSMAVADEALVYFNPKVLAHKKLESLSAEDVGAAFASKNVRVFTDIDKLQEALYEAIEAGGNLLMMSSGNFDGMDFEDLREHFEAAELM